MTTDTRFFDAILELTRTVARVEEKTDNIIVKQNELAGKQDYTNNKVKVVTGEITTMKTDFEGLSSRSKEINKKLSGLESDVIDLMTKSTDTKKNVKSNGVGIDQIIETTKKYTVYAVGIAGALASAIIVISEFIKNL